MSSTTLSTSDRAKAGSNVSQPSSPDLSTAAEASLEPPKNRGYSYVDGFNPGTESDEHPATPVKTRAADDKSSPAASNVVTPNSSAATIKRQIASTTDVPLKKKSKNDKPSLFELDLHSLASINSTYLQVKGASSKVPSNPIETFTTICLDYGVRELMILKKNLVGGEWPKGLNKGPAVKVFAKHYIQKLLGNNVEKENQRKCYVKVDDDYIELLRRVFEVLNFHDWVKYHVQRDLLDHLSSRRVLCEIQFVF